jgi:hypothetical protein
MRSIIQKLSQQDDEIRWLIEYIEKQDKQILMTLPDTGKPPVCHESGGYIPEYQKPPKLTLWQKITSILP